MVMIGTTTESKMVTTLSITSNPFNDRQQEAERDLLYLIVHSSKGVYTNILYMKETVFFFSLSCHVNFMINFVSKKL